MRLVSALLATALIVAASPAESAGLTGTADYIISLAGANIASLSVTLDDNAGHYRLAATAEVAGLGQFVTSGSASVEATGTSTPTALDSGHFSIETRTSDETFSAVVDYDHGTVRGFQVTPPVTNNIGRVPIERSQLSGVGDMLSAFVLKGGRLDPNLCQRTFHIFTGIERFDIALSFKANDVATSPRTGYQGPVVLCGMDYVPISGHFTTSEMTNYLANSDKLLIWYAPLGTTGYYIPYRVVIGTGIGDLSMVLTAMSGS